MNEPVASIMIRNLVTLSPDDTLDKARDIFLHKRIHHLPVITGDNTLVGLITTWDLFKLENSPDEYSEMRVKDVMTTHLATLEPDEKVGAAAEIFLENLFHAVPIVRDGKILGIVTSFDVLKYEFHKAYPNQVLV